MHRLAASALAAALTLAFTFALAAPARADEPQASDSEEPVVQPAAAPEPQPVPVPIGPPPPPPPTGYVPPAPVTERSLEGRTHNGVMPTGELVPANHTEIGVHNFIYMAGAIGLSDAVELDFSAPVVPIFAQAGLRVGLTPRSAPLKLVVGVNAWVSLVDHSAGDAAYSGTVTVAYQNERANLHGTLMFFSDLKSDDAVGVTSVGASYKASATVAAFFEISQVIAGDPNDSGTFYASSAGLKFLGEDTDVDAGILLLTLPDSSDQISIPLPFLSATHRF
jgi:hypothetical protein